MMFIAWSTVLSLSRRYRYFTFMFTCNVSTPDTVQRLGRTLVPKRQWPGRAENLCGASCIISTSHHSIRVKSLYDQAVGNTASAMLRSGLHEPLGHTSRPSLSSPNKLPHLSRRTPPEPCPLSRFSTSSALSSACLKSRFIALLPVLHPWCTLLDFHASAV